MPKSVQVGSVRYAVQCDETAGLQAKVNEQTTACLGSADHPAQLIRIDPNQGPDQLADTLLHEVMHAVFAFVGLHESPLAKHEERIVAALTPTLLDTLRRNPDLVAYVTSG